ncbi:MAG: hypothetical protein U0350_51565 [Caldilineaceae bacterium]
MSMILDLPTASERMSLSPIPSKLQEQLSTVYDSVFADLAKAYTIPDSGAVFAFLRQHSHLIPILLEGRAVVSFFFGEKTPVVLTLLRDSDAGLEYLVAWIKVALPSSEARETLLELGDTWLRTRNEVVGDRLAFNLGAL